MLDILFVVPYTPSLIRVRSYNLIRQLSQLGHRLTVMSLVSDTSEQADVNFGRGNVSGFSGCLC